jgi:hypothetical protein
MKKTITILILGIYLFSLISMANALLISSVSTEPSEVAPGETSRVSLTLKNNDDFDIEEVSTSLDFTSVPFAPYNSGSDYLISEILSGKTKSAEFDVVALSNAVSGIYKIPVKIEYRESGQADGTPNLIKTSLISIMINSKPILEVSSEDGLLLKNQKNKVSLKIVNKGLSDAKFLEISIQGNSYVTIISQPKVYIGDVDSNDFQTVDFDIFFKSNAPNSIRLPATIVYKDISNKEYTETMDVTLKAYSNEQAVSLGLVQQNYTGLIIIGVIITIIIFFVVRTILKRRKQNNKEY